MNMDTTKEQVKEKLLKLLELEDVKKGTKKARLIEWAMIQGMHVILGQNLPTYYTILLMSGRSVLDD